MSITLIKGRPGAGKSYECVVNHILPSLKEGRKVVTNIPLNVDHFAKVLGPQVRDLLVVEKFSFDNSSGSREDLFERYNTLRSQQLSENHDDPLPELNLSDISVDAPNLAEPVDYVSYLDWRNDKNQGVLFVIDECHFHFPRAGRNKSDMQLADRQTKFFSGHRHYGFDFVFLTQSDKKINTLLREDIEICIEVRKNRAMGDKSYVRYVFYYGDGKRNGLIEQDTRKYEDKFFPFYKSHTKSTGEVQEANIKDLKKWHQHWIIRLAIILLVIGVISSFNALSKIFGEKESPAVESAHQAPVPEVSQPTTPYDSTVEEVDEHVDNSSPDFSDLPFGNFDISIEGYSDSSYKDNRGVYHIQKQVYFKAVNSASFAISLKLDDFYLAGYQVLVYGPCMARLMYKDISKLVYCQGTSLESSGAPSVNLF